jgi:hypothetical protein
MAYNVYLAQDLQSFRAHEFVSLAECRAIVLQVMHS